jgi:hypothetical protein
MLENGEEAIMEMHRIERLGVGVYTRCGAITIAFGQSAAGTSWSGGLQVAVAHVVLEQCAQLMVRMRRAWSLDREQE